MTTIIAANAAERSSPTRTPITMKRTTPITVRTATATASAGTACIPTATSPLPSFMGAGLCIWAVMNAGAELAYIKTDGSLNDGLELVSHPCTLDYHLNKVPWAEGMDCLRQMGYRSHNAGTCGLHVHVNRSALGKTIFEQEEVIARLLYLFERFWQEILRFSRRTENQIDHWAARYGYKDTGREILEQAKISSHPGRYACINLTNADTIEFRVFRGTLRYATFAATLQFVDRLCHVVLANHETALRRLSWPELVICLVNDQTPELTAYLKERRLYSNDPVCADVEV